jgi:hypothetical protein
MHWQIVRLAYLHLSPCDPYDLPRVCRRLRKISPSRVAGRDLCCHMGPGDALSPQLHSLYIALESAFFRRCVAVQIGFLIQCTNDMHFVWHKNLLAKIFFIFFFEEKVFTGQGHAETNLD